MTRSIPEGTDEEVLLHMYTTAVKIRKFETKVYEVFNLNLIPGTMHLYRGEEAVATGVCANLTDDDYITSTHRGHGHCIAKGADLKKMMAELFGRRDGYSKGRGGSMHIADFSIGILGANGVVGAGIPISTGAGLSCKLEARFRGKDRMNACASFFGDGASNQGANFHGSLNLAAIWDLPILFVLENNFYAMGTAIKRMSRLENQAEKAKAYGMPGITVDGNDVIAVYLAAKEAINRAKNGKGPTLLECKTYRHYGHSKFDPATYRPEEEKHDWVENRDPIERFTEQLLDFGIGANQIEDINLEVDTMIEEAVEFAKTSPEPTVEHLFEDLYAGGN
ncbi:pyruvate dehydrogenase (acetyl-transferring) E1 component subunit alpha [Candidatus Bathyarchaeota archaeon]|nr:pyruvate dehydrogenase (acetyl-transferring) E1 component subunit alpha [Candidatus Bathyarchaeota archaeon]